MAIPLLEKLSSRLQVHVTIARSVAANASCLCHNETVNRCVCADLQLRGGVPRAKTEPSSGPERCVLLTSPAMPSNQLHTSCKSVLVTLLARACDGAVQQLKLKLH